MLKSLFQRVALVCLVLAALCAPAHAQISATKFIQSFAQAQNPQCNYNQARIIKVSSYDLLAPTYAYFDQCFKEAAYANSWATLKHYNPDMLIFVYINGAPLYSLSSWPIRATPSIATIKSTNGSGTGDNWFLTPRASGGVYVGESPYLVGPSGDDYDNNNYMNLTKTNWLDFWIGSFATWNGRANPYYPGTINTSGVDGLFADNSNFPAVACCAKGPLYRQGRADNETYKDAPAEYGLPFTTYNADFNAATFSYMNYVVPRLQSTYGLKIIPNWFYLNSPGLTGLDGWTHTNAMANPPYAGMCEGCIVSQTGHKYVADDEPAQPTELTYFIHGAEAVTNTKILVDNTISGCGQPLSLDNTSIVGGASGMNCGEEFWHAFGITLLAYNTVNQQIYFGFSDHNDPDWQDELDPNYLHLGNQVGLAFKIGAIWWREFDDGYVAVNSTGATVSGITLPVTITHTDSVGSVQGRVCNHANFKTAGNQCGANLVSSFSLLRNRAVILLKSGKSITNSDNSSTVSTLVVTTTSPMPDGTESAAYSKTLAATGGTGAYTWSVVSGSLPTGITRTGAVLSGTPSVAGVYSFTVRVTDSTAGTPLTNDKALTITIAATGGGDPAMYTRSQSFSDAFTNSSTACLDSYSASNWELINDGGSTNCVKVDASADTIYGNGDSYYGWVARNKLTYSDDQYASLKIAALPADSSEGAQFVGVGVRIGAATGASRNLYGAVVYKVGTTQYTALVKILAGALTTLKQTTTETWAVNARIELEAFGDEITLLHDGTPVLQYTDTGTTITGGAPGVVMAGGTGTRAAGDDFHAGNLINTDSVHISGSAGDDGDTGGASDPFETINHGLSVVSGGGEVLLCAAVCGTGSETYLVDIDELDQAPPSGSSGAPTIIRGYPGNTITIKPNTTKCTVVNLTNADYIKFQDLTLDADDLSCGAPVIITLDATRTGTQAAGSTTRTLTSVVVSSVSNGGLLLVAVDYDNNVGSALDCTYNTSETMTLVSVISGVNYAGQTVFELRNPSVTTASVVCHLTDAGLVSSIQAMSLHGVDQLTPIRDYDTAGGTGMAAGTLTLTSVSGDMVIDFAHMHNPSTTGMTPGVGQTERYDINASDFSAAGSTKVATGTSTSMSYSWTDNITNVHTALGLKPTGSGGGGSSDVISLASGAAHISFENITATKGTDECLSSAGIDTEFSGGRLTDCGKGATLGGDSSSIDGTEVDTQAMRGVIIAANDVTVQNSNIHDNGSDGIATSGSIADCRIINNDLSENGGLDISIAASTPTGCEVYYNSSNSNNIPAVNITAGSGHLFVNNVVYPGTVVADAATSTTNLTSDPTFVNAPTDLSLDVGSAAIDAATDIPSVTTDKDGNDRTAGLPDIGAHERGTRAVITAISSNVLRQGQAKAFTITGTGFQLGSGAVTVSGANVTPSGLTIVSDTSITVTLTAGGSAAVGDRTVTVDTDAGVGQTGITLHLTPKGGPAYYYSLSQ